MKSLLFTLSIFFIFSACNEKKSKVFTLEDLQRINEKSIELNKAIVKHKNDSIIDFITKNNLKMSETGTGLWYSIDKSNSNDSILLGDIIEYTYTCKLLNGTICYSSDSLGPKVLKVGQGGVEAGLEEAFLLMQKGDKARLLIPPHLAHGLQGDLQKIPPLAILDYSIEITRHKSIHN